MWSKQSTGAGTSSFKHYLFPAQTRSMTQMSKRSREKRFQYLPLTIAVPAVIVLVFLAYSVNENWAQKKGDSEIIKAKENLGSNEIVIGDVNGIAYYHCSGNDSHLVLLHGAKFTKEDWKSSGILSNLCQATGLSVSAMDLPVSAGHDELKSLLTAMQKIELLKMPVTVVTPSASGKTITDWMTNGDVSELPSYVSKWIPIASYSAMHPSDKDVSSLVGNLAIFAVYGSRDGKGKEVTERLAKLASAETLEVEGGHPCYLDRPDDFVAAILKNMNLSI